MRTLTVEEARAIDLDATQRLGMPTLLLMENAGRSVAELARTLGDTFVALCGPGNNGGDGLVAARHLGASCSIVLAEAPHPVRSPDAAMQHRILRNAGIVIRTSVDPMWLKNPRLVWIDALLGIGVTRPVAGAIRAQIQAFNEAIGTKLSVDIPSGLDADSGVLHGEACRADRTITFIAPKAGMLVPGVHPIVGEIVVAGLGLPDSHGVR